jgi:hypothetical protein
MDQRGRGRVHRGSFIQLPVAGFQLPAGASREASYPPIAGFQLPALSAERRVIH